MWQPSADDERPARRPWGVVLVACAVALLALLPGTASLLQYDRLLIARGEWWRLVTCHLVHWTPQHLFWDLLMFGILLERALAISVRRTMLMLGAATVMISLSVQLFLPEMFFYRGLSGIDSALFVFVLLHMLQQSHKADMAFRFAPAILLLFFVAKVGYEFVSGSTVFVTSMGAGVCGVPLAHLTGAITGALFSWQRSPVSVDDIVGVTS